MSDATRVVFIAPVAVSGGAGQYLLDAVTPRPERGYEPTVVFLADGPMVKRCRDAGVPVHVIDAGRLRDPRAGLRAIRMLRASLARLRPSVVVATETKAMAYVWPAARSCGLLVACLMHTYPGRHPIDVMARIFSPDLVIASSRGLAQAHRGRSPVTVVHPGVEPSRFTSERRRSDDAGLTYGIVGRLQPWKGQHLFLDAAAVVAKAIPDSRFEVVGAAEMGWERGDYPADLKRQAHALGLGERVAFTGWSDDVSEVLARLDVVVSASDREPFGISIIEAMAAGCAVVAVAAGGPLEIIEHPETGLLVDAREGPGLSEAMVALGRDPQLRHQIGRRAAAAVESRFSVAAMSAGFTAAIESLIADA